MRLLPLIQARAKKGFTSQAMLAEAIGLKREQVNRMENCQMKGMPRAPVLVKLSEVLEIPFEEVYNWFNKAKQ